MSSQYYGVEEMGLYVKIDELNLTAIREDFFPDYDTNVELKEDGLYEDICLKGGGCISPKQTFGGSDGYYTARSLTDSDISSIDVDKDDWFICCLTRYPSLYRQPYMDENELIDEMRRTYSKYLLNKDFDYKSRLIQMSCVCYG